MRVHPLFRSVLVSGSLVAGSALGAASPVVSAIGWDAVPKILARIARASVVGMALLLAVDAPLRADITSDVHAAVRLVTEGASYSWEVRVARFFMPAPRGPGVLSQKSEGSPELKVLPGVLEAGQMDGEGISLIKVHFTEKILGRSQLLAGRGRRERIAETPSGWLTDLEIRNAMPVARGTMIQLNGRSVSLFDCLGLAGSSLSWAIRPDVELSLLLTDIESFTHAGDLFIGELSEVGRKRISRRILRSNPNAPARVVLRIVDGQLREYLVTDRQSPTRPSEFMGAAVVISRIGTTPRVVLPQAAFDRLGP